MRVWKRARGDKRKHTPLGYLSGDDSQMRLDFADAVVVCVCVCLCGSLGVYSEVGCLPWCELAKRWAYPKPSLGRTLRFATSSWALPFFPNELGLCLGFQLFPADFAAIFRSDFVSRAATRRGTPWRGGLRLSD